MIGSSVCKAAAVRIRNLVKVQAMALLLALWSCGPPLSTDQRILRLLDEPEFVFVGVETRGAEVRPGVFAPVEDPHGFEPQTLPDRLEFGKSYIFHSTFSVDHERMALEILPRRLERLGARIISRPESEMDLLRPFLGGVAFGIQFEIEGRKAWIGSSGPCVIYEEPEVWYLQDYDISVEEPDAEPTTLPDRSDIESQSQPKLSVLQEKEAVASNRFVKFGALELRHVKFPFRESSEKRNDLTERTVPQMNRSMVTLLVGREPVVQVEDFEPAKLRLEDRSMPRKLILLPFTERGRAKLADWSENNAGERIGLFIDGVLIVMPWVEAKLEVVDYFPIGNLLEEEAEEILSKLRKLASN